MTMENSSNSAFLKRSSNLVRCSSSAVSTDTWTNQGQKVARRGSPTSLFDDSEKSESGAGAVLTTWDKRRDRTVDKGFRMRELYIRARLDCPGLRLIEPIRRLFDFVHARDPAAPTLPCEGGCSLEEAAAKPRRIRIIDKRYNDKSLNLVTLGKTITLVERRSLRLGRDHGLLPMSPFFRDATIILSEFFQCAYTVAFGLLCFWPGLKGKKGNYRYDELLAPCRTVQILCGNSRTVAVAGGAGTSDKDAREPKFSFSFVGNQCSQAGAQVCCRTMASAPPQLGRVSSCVILVFIAVALCSGSGKGGAPLREGVAKKDKSAAGGAINLKLQKKLMRKIKFELAGKNNKPKWASIDRANQKLLGKYEKFIEKQRNHQYKVGEEVQVEVARQDEFKPLMTGIVKGVYSKMLAVESLRDGVTREFPYDRVRAVRRDSESAFSLSESLFSDSNESVTYFENLKALPAPISEEYGEMIEESLHAGKVHPNLTAIAPALPDLLEAIRKPKRMKTRGLMLGDSPPATDSLSQPDSPASDSGCSDLFVEKEDEKEDGSYHRRLYARDQGEGIDRDDGFVPPSRDEVRSLFSGFIEEQERREGQTGGRRRPEKLRRIHTGFSPPDSCDDDGRPYHSPRQLSFKKTLIKEFEDRAVKAIAENRLKGLGVPSLKALPGIIAYVNATMDGSHRRRSNTTNVRLRAPRGFNARNLTRERRLEIMRFGGKLLTNISLFHEELVEDRRKQHERYLERRRRKRLMRQSKKAGGGGGLGEGRDVGKRGRDVNVSSSSSSSSSSPSPPLPFSAGVGEGGGGGGGGGEGTKEAAGTKEAWRKIQEAAGIFDNDYDDCSEGDDGEENHENDDHHGGGGGGDDGDDDNDDCAATAPPPPPSPAKRRVPREGREARQMMTMMMRGTPKKGRVVDGGDGTRRGRNDARGADRADGDGGELMALGNDDDDDGDDDEDGTGSSGKIDDGKDDGAEELSPLPSNVHDDEMEAYFRTFFNKSNEKYLDFRQRSRGPNQDDEVEERRALFSTTEPFGFVFKSAIVLQVNEGSQAERLGVRAGQQIASIAGHPIDPSSISPKELFDTIAKAKAVSGSTMEMTFKTAAAAPPSPEVFTSPGETGQHSRFRPCPSPEAGGGRRLHAAVSAPPPSIGDTPISRLWGEGKGSKESFAFELQMVRDRTRELAGEGEEELLSYVEERYRQELEQTEEKISRLVKSEKLRNRVAKMDHEERAHFIRYLQSRADVRDTIRNDIKKKGCYVRMDTARNLPGSEEEQYHHLVSELNKNACNYTLWLRVVVPPTTNPQKLNRKNASVNGDGGGNSTTTSPPPSSVLEEPKPLGWVPERRPWERTSVGYGLQRENYVAGLIMASNLPSGWRIPITRNRGRKFYDLWNSEDPLTSTSDIDAEYPTENLTTWKSRQRARWLYTLQEMEREGLGPRAFRGFFHSLSDDIQREPRLWELFADAAAVACGRRNSTTPSKEEILASSTTRVEALKQSVPFEWAVTLRSVSLLHAVRKFPSVSVRSLFNLLHHNPWLWPSFPHTRLLPGSRVVSRYYQKYTDPEGGVADSRAAVAGGGGRRGTQSFEVSPWGAPGTVLEANMEHGELILKIQFDGEANTGQNEDFGGDSGRMRKEPSRHSSHRCSSAVLRKLIAPVAGTIQARIPARWVLEHLS
eukprot:jgi/Bigna1/81939/fgenesh1_pg.86_\